jgi:hypothetical protein
MIIDVLPEWKERFSGLFARIERIVQTSGAAA